MAKPEYINPLQPNRDRNIPEDYNPNVALSDAGVFGVEEIAASGFRTVYIKVGKESVAVLADCESRIVLPKLDT